MAKKTHLRPVSPGEKPPAPRTPKNITEALEGTSRDVMAAMRKQLAQKLDAGEVASNSIASAYKELRELDRLIREFDRVSAEEVAGDSSDGDESFDASAI